MKIVRIILILVIIAALLATIFNVDVMVVFWILVVLGGIFLIASIKKDSDNKKEMQNKHDDMRKNLRDSQWVQRNPTLADKYRRELEQATAGAEVKIYHGHYYGAYDETWIAGDPDSAGGWDLNINIRNIGYKTINYIDITVTPYDSIGNKVFGNFNVSTTNLKYTGPLYSQSSENLKDMHAWYDCSVARVVIDNIHITFSDGTTQDIDSHGDVKNYDRNGNYKKVV